MSLHADCPFLLWQPVVNSKLALPGLAYNLHSQIGLENEPGAGEDAFTVLIGGPRRLSRCLRLTLFHDTWRPLQTTRRPRSSSSSRASLATRARRSCESGRGGACGCHLIPQHHWQPSESPAALRSDISKYVDAAKSTILPGGTAYCADSETLWVAVSAPAAAASTLVTVDLSTGAVTANISYTNPILAAHFADCKGQRVGGLTIQVGRGDGTPALGRWSGRKCRSLCMQPLGASKAVVAGWLSADGFFNAFDHATLPEGSTYEVRLHVRLAVCRRGGGRKSSDELMRPGDCTRSAFASERLPSPLSAAAAPGCALCRFLRLGGVGAVTGHGCPLLQAIHAARPRLHDAQPGGAQ